MAMASIQQMIKPEITDLSNVHRMFGSGEIAIFQQRTIIMPEVEKIFIFCQPDKKIENVLPHSRNFK